MNNELIEKVQALYAAFERGDLASIVAGLAPTVDFRVNVAPDLPGADHPIFTAYRKAGDVPRFFEGLIGTLEPRGMVPRGLALTVDGRGVLALLHEKYIVRKTGKELALDTVHHWTFDEAGKVVAWRGYTDTATELRAIVG